MLIAAGANPMRLYFSVGDIALYCGDFLEFDALPPESVDLIVTSPPYNLGVEYDGYADECSWGDYLEFIERALRKCLSLLKPDGRMCLNVPLDSFKFEPRSVYADILSCALSVGFKYKGTIIWLKREISRRTAWGSFCSASSPTVIAPVETIILLYKESWKKLNRGVSDIQKDEFIAWSFGVWDFPYPPQKFHPAAFPIELPKRCIKLFSYVGDLVLDPFVGSGTTLLAAYLLRRRGVGVEISEKYCEVAKQRLLDINAPLLL